MPSRPKKKINKEISELNDSIYQIDLTDIYRILNPAVAHGTFSKKKIKF
jgi:hypothetical protein